LRALIVSFASIVATPSSESFFARCQEAYTLSQAHTIALRMSLHADSITNPERPIASFSLI
jgi:hypothetical protein